MLCPAVGKTHASITWNIELLGPLFPVSDPQQMDAEAGDEIQHLGSSTTPSRDLVPLMGEKIKNPYLQWKMWMDYF